MTRRWWFQKSKQEFIFVNFHPDIFRDKHVSFLLVLLLNSSRFSIRRPHQKVRVTRTDWDLVLRHQSEAGDLSRSARSQWKTLCSYTSNPDSSIFFCFKATSTATHFILKIWHIAVYIDSLIVHTFLSSVAANTHARTRLHTPHSFSLPTCLPSVMEHACGRPYLCI